MDEFRRELGLTFFSLSRKNLDSDYAPTPIIHTKKQIELPRFLYKSFNVHFMQLSLTSALLGLIALSGFTILNNFRSSFSEQAMHFTDMQIEYTQRMQLREEVLNALLIEKDLMTEFRSGPQSEKISKLEGHLQNAESLAQTMSEFHAEEIAEASQHFSTFLIEFRKFNTELTEWILSGDMDLAGNLYFDRGLNLRNGIDFHLDKINTAGNVYRANLESKIRNLKSASSELVFIVVFLLAALVVGSYVLWRQFLNSLKICVDGIRRESYLAFKQSGTLEKPELTEHIANMRIHVTEIIQILFGNKSGERQPRPDQIDLTEKSSEKKVA